MINSTKQPYKKRQSSSSYSLVKSLKLFSRNSKTFSSNNNKSSLSNEHLPRVIDLSTLSSPSKNNNLHIAKNVYSPKNPIPTSPSHKKQKSMYHNHKMTLKKKPKQQFFSFDMSGELSSPNYYPYRTFHKKCISLNEKDKLSATGQNVPVIVKDLNYIEPQKQNGNNNNIIKVIPNQQVQPQPLSQFLFWEKKSNSNSTNMTSMKDPLSDYNDLSSMLGSRLNFKSKTKLSKGGITKPSSHFSQTQKNFFTRFKTAVCLKDKQPVRSCKRYSLSYELNQDKIINEAKGDGSLDYINKKLENDNTYDNIENNEENQIVQNYLSKIEKREDEEEDLSNHKSLSSLEEMENMPLAEPKNEQKFNFLKIKHKNFTKQLSRISEISVKQSKDNDNSSNNDLNSQFMLELNHTMSSDHPQKKTIKNKLKNLNELLENNNQNANQQQKRPLSFKASSKSNLILSKTNTNNKKNNEENAEVSNGFASSSSSQSSSFFLKRSNTNKFSWASYNFLGLSPSATNRRKSNQNSILSLRGDSFLCLKDCHENEELIAKKEKLINYLSFSCDFTKKEKLEKYKEYYVNKAVNSVTNKLGNIIDFDPENSLLNHDEIGTKGYFRSIKHSKIKVNEDFFIYYFHFTYGFFKRDNLYLVPRPKNERNRTQKYDNIYIRKNTMYSSFNKFLLEAFFQVHLDLKDYLFHSNYFNSGFKKNHRESLISNFSSHDRKYSSSKNKLLDIRRILTKQLKNKSDKFSNHIDMIYQNCKLMTRDLNLSDLLPYRKFREIERVKKSTCSNRTTKMKKNRLSICPVQKGSSKKTNISTTENGFHTAFSPTKFNETEIKKRICKFLVEQPSSGTGSDKSMTKDDKIPSLNPNEHFILRKIAKKTEESKPLSPSSKSFKNGEILLQKETVLLRTHEIKNEIINNFNSIEESLIFHTKDGNYHNFLELMTKYKITEDIRDDKGNTLLILATHSNCMEIIEYLVSRGFDINGYNNNHNTALHYAISYRNFELVDYLIKNGADENIKNNDNIIPWMCLTTGITLD